MKNIKRKVAGVVLSAMMLTGGAAAAPVSAQVPTSPVLAGSNWQKIPDLSVLPGSNWQKIPDLGVLPQNCFGRGVYQWGHSYCYPKLMARFYPGAVV